MKKPQFNNKFSKPEKMFYGKYVQTDIRDISLEELIKSLPKNVKFSDVIFMADAEIEYSYYNEATAQIENLSAYYPISGENPNYEKEAEDYKNECDRYSKEIQIYTEWLKQEEIKTPKMC
jgi:hypothetical protein